MIHPWLQDTWRRLMELGERLPHALLFVGPPGVGKRDLADALAAHLLCLTPQVDGTPCGVCAGCTLRLSGNHPDLLRVIPAADAQDGGETDAPSDGAAKAKSSQIVIEQVRDLQASLMVTGHQGSRRVAIVHPADAMNVFTANALLKLLEEPPQGCTLVLVSSTPRRLLPTIRSRCQQWQFARPDPALVREWLRDGDAAAHALLALSGGLPLSAERLALRGVAPLVKRFVEDVASLPATDPLRLAGQWDAWLKSKEASAAGFGITELVDWMQRWVTDLAMLRLGGRGRYFPAQEATLRALAEHASVSRVTTCYNEFTQIRRVSQHPLNARLMLEDMLLRYARAVSGARS